MRADLRQETAALPAWAVSGPQGTAAPLPDAAHAALAALLACCRGDPAGRGAGQSGNHRA